MTKAVDYRPIQLNHRRTTRIAFDVYRYDPYGTALLVPRGALWTPGLCEYLIDCEVEYVFLETVDGFGRILEKWEQDIGD